MRFLAVAAVLSVAASGVSGPRVPGLGVRFGQSVSQVDSTRAWAAAAAPVAGSALRTARAPFFGVPCDVKLHFAGDRLASVEASTDSASLKQIDYVQDELRRLGLHRACDVDGPGRSRCTWSGRATVTLEIQGTRLSAALTPPPPPPPPPLAAAPRFDGPAPEFDLEHLDATAPWPAPEVTHREKPVIPTIAREAGVFGRVRIRASVDSTGAVTVAEVAKSIPMLDAAALRCVRLWRFKPYTPAGRARDFRIVVPVLFVLD